MELTVINQSQLPIILAEKNKFELFSMLDEAVSVFDLINENGPFTAVIKQIKSDKVEMTDEDNATLLDSNGNVKTKEVMYFFTDEMVFKTSSAVILSKMKLLYKNAGEEMLGRTYTFKKGKTRSGQTCDTFEVA